MMKPVLIAESLENVNVGENLIIYGRVSSVRDQKKRVFFDIRDHTGQIQVVVEKNETYKNRDILPGSYVEVTGTLNRDLRGNNEVISEGLTIIAPATLRLNPSPWDINGLYPEYAKSIFDHTSFYLANPQRAAVLRIKTNFVRALHEYYDGKNFTLVEPPIITNKTLYPEETAIKVDVHDENLFLTQCATFELEPLALVYGKVYCISPAFRNERGGSKRHLTEYSHAKAEILMVDIEDLMQFTGDLLYNSIKTTVESCQEELSLLGKDIDVEKIHPKNHEKITYDEALKIVHKKGSKTEYGKGLCINDETMLTEYVGNNYLWVQFPPFTSEGFPYKRKSDQKHLSMTCDLIAPHRAGEIVGVAEKTTDAEELIENLIEKGKKNRIRDYWEYILLRNYGLPPHGGIGAAPERIIYGLLGLDHVRLTKPWPRYPDRKIRYNDFQLNPWKNQDVQRLISKYAIK
jgi:asparaginyl-tRNA synthetase